jgi:lipoyl-dependent peroxiredoxin
MTARNGTAEWQGDVRTGSGTVVVGDGVFEGPYSYGSRLGDDAGTNPEQLIAAAHAACFTMALANQLGEAGHPPKSLHTDANLHLRLLDDALTIARIDLATRGDVEGIDQQRFQAFAEEAKRSCVVSRALAAVPEITLTASLE